MALCWRKASSHRRVKVDCDRICALRIDSPEQPLFVLSVYLPPAGSRLADFIHTLDILQHTVEWLSTEGLVCVVGDLNAQLGPGAGPRGRNLQPSRLGALLLTMMSKCNLVAVDMLDTSTGPCYTFLRGERPISYIDHCLLSSTLIKHVNKCEVLDDHHLNFSDHLSVAHLSSLSCAGTAHVTMTETAQSEVVWTCITSDDLQILYTDRVSVELAQLRREYALTSDVVCVKEDILDSLIDRILWI